MTKRAQASTSSTPSDLDLMLYFDGELEDASKRTAVEEFLKAERDGRRKLLALGMVGELLREDAEAIQPRADGIADAVMAQVTKEAKPATEASPVRMIGTKKPANDNSRTIFAIAALAVAAAAALMVWGRTGNEIAPPAPVAVHTATPAPSMEAPNPQNGAAPAPVMEGTPEHGVEIATVDFGANGGTIISNETTTVLWVQDEGSGD